MTRYFFPTGILFILLLSLIGLSANVTCLLLLSRRFPVDTLIEKLHGKINAAALDSLRQLLNINYHQTEEAYRMNICFFATLLALTLAFFIFALYHKRTLG